MEELFGMYNESFKWSLTGMRYMQYWTSTLYTADDRYVTIEGDFTPVYYKGMRDLQEVINLNTDPETAAQAAFSGPNQNQIAVSRILKAFAFHNLTDQKVLKVIDEGKGWSEPTDPGYFDGDSVAEINNVSPAAGQNNPYRNVILAKPTMLKTEQQAIRNNNEATSRRWRVMTPGVRDSLGRMPSYVLMPLPGTTPLALEGSSLSNRAKMLYNHFWATPYQRDEIYPAGMYPASNQKWEGLPKWTTQDRNIENSDVVLWYVMGKTHIVRSEDWPIMNRAYMSFQLVPFGFFEQNPALGVPPVTMPDGLTNKTTPDKNLSGQKTPASGERE